MDKRHISEKYTEIGEKLINEDEELDYIKISNVSVVFLASEIDKKSGGRLILGQCEKIAEKYKWGIPADFTITVFEPNVDGFTDEQIKILLFHELLHIGIDFTDDGEKYYVRPHDLEDFRLVINRYGTEWDRNDKKAGD